MGGALSSVGGAAGKVGGMGGSAIGGGAGGINGLLSPLGLGGEQGASFHGTQYNPALDQMNADAMSQNDPNFQSKLQDYSNGKGTQQDLFSGLNQSQINQAYAGPMTGSQLATSQVQSNPILGQLYGQGGALNRANTEEQQLASTGYQLQPQDVTAYGQASGDIARLFGQNENNLGQSLADRGLASSPNGAAAVGFSGLQGNKNEMLAKAQTDIANQRMQNNLQRLSETRNFMSQLGAQGAGAINDQYGRNMSGVNNYQNNLARTAGQQQSAQNATNSMHQEELSDQRSAKGKTLFSALGNGLFAGAQGSYLNGSAGSAYGNGSSGGSGATDMGYNQPAYGGGYTDGSANPNAASSGGKAPAASSMVGLLG